MGEDASLTVNAVANQTSAMNLSTPWPNRKEDYELKDIVGVGATASVYSALCLPRNKEPCAIKRINLERCHTSMDELSHEIQAMSQCAHPNVVNYYTSFVVGEELWVIMRLLSCGSMLDIIKRKKKLSGECTNGVLDETTIATVLKEVLKGLDYFHSNGQIHRDIKAGNILLSVDGSVQIADFGVSSWLAMAAGDLSRQKVRHTFVGTPCWMAPEVMEQVSGYNFKADIWSFGILCIELATGTAPYHQYPPMKVLLLTLQNEPPTLDSNAASKEQYKAYGKTFRKVITDCLQKEPNKRPTAAELLKYSFFKKAKDKKWLVDNLIENLAGIVVKPVVEDEPTSTNAAYRPGSSGQFKKEGEQWVFSEYDQSNDDARPQLIAEETTPSDVQQEIAAQNLNPSTPSIQPIPNGALLALVLRVRSADRRELNDIKFDFLIGEDTVDGVAAELVAAGLIDGQDTVITAANLNKVVDAAIAEGESIIDKQADEVRRISVTFRLQSQLSSNEVPDERTLVGYAQISLTGVSRGDA